MFPPSIGVWCPMGFSIGISIVLSDSGFGVCYGVDFCTQGMANWSVYDICVWWRSLLLGLGVCLCGKGGGGRGVVYGLVEGRL